MCSMSFKNAIITTYTLAVSTMKFVFVVIISITYVLFDNHLPKIGEYRGRGLIDQPGQVVTASDKAYK